MNERIKELAEQATRVVDGGPDLWSMPKEVFDKEKFAELIIKECGEIAAFGDPKYSAQYNIHKHFGVE